MRRFISCLVMCLVISGLSVACDNDGQAGGDYVFTVEHRERHDSYNDNDIDLIDLFFMSNYLYYETTHVSL